MVIKIEENNKLGYTHEKSQEIKKEWSELKDEYLFINSMEVQAVELKKKMDKVDLEINMYKG
jgi:hypothetical protein